MLTVHFSVLYTWKLAKRMLACLREAALQPEKARLKRWWELTEVTYYIGTRILLSQQFRHSEAILVPTAKIAFARSGRFSQIRSHVHGVLYTVRYTTQQITLCTKFEGTFNTNISTCTAVCSAHGVGVYLSCSSMSTTLYICCLQTYQDQFGCIHTRLAYQDTACYTTSILSRECM